MNCWGGAAREYILLAVSPDLAPGPAESFEVFESSDLSRLTSLPLPARSSVLK